MKFIEDIKVAIIKRCPLTEAETRRCIELWESGEPPVTPAERGVFCLCDEIKRQLDEMED